MKRQLWQHGTSGEVYAVELRPDGTVLDAAGPLHKDDQAACLAKGFEGEPDDAAWVQQHAASFGLKEA